MEDRSVETKSIRRWQQAIYVLAPLFILLLILALINVIPVLLTTNPTTPPQPDNELTSVVTAVPPTATLVPVPPVIPTTQPTFIPTVTLPPDAAIELLGPPDDSSFRQQDTISFFADWPYSLDESQQLAAYVRFDGQAPTLLGALDEPNIGQRYRWQLNLGETVVTAVSMEWWVQLQNKVDDLTLLSSATRQLNLLP